MDVVMKQCCTCHELLPVTEFNKRAKAFDGLQSRCRACSRLWYEANRETHGANTRKRSKKVRADLFARICDYLLQHPCVDCGEADIRCLDFDHRDPLTKRDAVCRMVVNCHSWTVIEREIEKCDVRCSNCHRRRTAEQFNTQRHRLVMRLADVAEPQRFADRAVP